MRLSRKADYALRAVRYFSNLPKGELGSINAVAQAETIPREFLAKILRDLTHGRILASFQGVGGGYRLVKNPREVSFLDVIEVIEGPLHINLCTDPKNTNCPCDQMETCEMRNFWVAQEESFKRTLARHNFGRYRQQKR